MLRWLLKRLKAGKNYRVDPASFLLLRQLIDFIAPKNLATILKEHKLLSTVCETIADLETDIYATLGSGLSIADVDSESDSASQDEKTGSQGTKRKRGSAENDPDAMDVDTPPQNPASCFLTFIRALDCLHGVVTLAQRTVGTDEVANSHLKLALRGDPEVIASSLGKAFQLAAIATTQFSQTGKTTDLQHLLYVFPAMLDLWDLRSLRRDDTDNLMSNDCFARLSFSHALRLQFCLRNVNLDTDERAYLLHGIERITALHVLLPVRAAFFERGGSGIDFSHEQPDWSAVEPVTNSLKPIIKENSNSGKSSDGGKADSFHSLWPSVELLPELFDNAVRAVPRDDFKRQTHEAPWLETLFVAVAELAYSTAKEDDPRNFHPRFVLVLEQLLRVSLERNIGLSLPCVLAHARYTGLLEEDLTEVQWTVTALVISLGVDVFLPNSGLRDTRKFLDALLDKIMLQWRSGMVSGSEEFHIIKDDVVLPLLRGFAAARDLSAFLEVWQNQLVTMEQQRAQDDSLSLFSVWEDDDLCNEFSEVIGASLFGAAFSNFIQNTATEMIADDGKISDTPPSYARFVAVEAGSRGRSFDSIKLEASLIPLLEAITKTLSSKQNIHWRWRLWRFVRNLTQNDLHAPDNALRQRARSLIPIASKTLHRNHKNLTKTPLVALESWEAYRFALVSIKGKPVDEDLAAFGAISKDMISLVTSVTRDDARKSMEIPWNGRIDTLDSPTTLALAYILALVRSPEVWETMLNENRSHLFQHILSLAASQYHSSSLPLEAVADDARFLQAWASVVCHEYLLNVPCLVPDIALLLNKTIEQDCSDRRLYVESLQRIPTALITRGLRTTLLNRLQDVLVQQDTTSEVTVGVLTMMAKLAAMPKCDATVTSEWEPIWTAARAITLEGTERDLQIMKSFRSLHRAIISKLLLIAKEDRTGLFKKLFTRVSKQASKLRQIDRDSMACFLLRLSLSELWDHRSKLQNAFSEDELASCRQSVFNLVLADMKSVKDQCRKQKLEETITLIKTIDALEDFEDLATNNIDVEKFLSKIEHYMAMSIDSAPSRLIRRRLLATKGPDRSITQPVLQCAETLPLQSLYAEDQQLFIRATTERFRSMTIPRITQAISEVRELGFTGQNAEYRILVVYLAIISLPAVEDKESEVACELSLVCTALANTLVHGTSIEQFCFASECLTLLLRVHTRTLAQCNIDTILAAIATSASKTGPRISPEYAATVFTRLCRLMGTVLSLQRLKINGRFHLVVNVMQRLLGCLFARSRKRSRSARIQTSLSQPFWLAPLEASQASSYTRLLTTLSDPTVSAVLRPQPGASRDALNDETKKAKRIAGQHLQYVVMEYAQCSLRGSLSPEVKAALLPGLYASLDVMSKESLRSLNAALDVSGRAVFKSLYDDYVKFGKWNKA